MTPLPWSHSSLVTHSTCPRQFEEIKVLRNFQDQKNEASLWGDEVHRAFETHLNAPDAPLPANMQMYNDYIAQFYPQSGETLLVEQQYGLNRKLMPTDFYAKDVWARGIIDVLRLKGNVAKVDDHKTGKNRKKDMQQLIIFALMTFYHHAEIAVVHCTFHWTQLNAKDTETFYRHQIPELWHQLMPKLEAYAKSFHTGIFPPKSSGLCKRHCAVKTCEYFGGARR